MSFPNSTIFQLCQHGKEEKEEEEEKKKKRLSTHTFLHLLQNHGLLNVAVATCFVTSKFCTLGLHKCYVIKCSHLNFT